MSGPLHSKASAEWYTPYNVIITATAVMGGIDLDPASCEEANKPIMAKQIYTKEDNGLIQPWTGRVFLNPPTGLVKEFWAQLMLEWSLRNIEQAIWIGYSLEQLQTLQNAKAIGNKTPLDFSMCVPSKRLSFIPEQVSGKKNSPTHGNYITYMGPNKEYFNTIFKSIGQVVIR